VVIGGSDQASRWWLCPAKTEEQDPSRAIREGEEKTVLWWWWMQAVTMMVGCFSGGVANTAAGGELGAVNREGAKNRGRNSNPVAAAM